jgi:hypothetical protein
MIGRAAPDAPVHSEGVSVCKFCVSGVMVQWLFLMVCVLKLVNVIVAVMGMCVHVGTGAHTDRSDDYRS